MEDKRKKERAEYVVDIIHRTLMHHFLWFSEVRHQMGDDIAYETLHRVLKKSLEIQMKKIGRVLDFETKDGIPLPLLTMEEKKMESLIEALSLNWIANDGVWFQNIEFDYGMNDAKRCNDSCWSNFSPFEARSIKKLLGIPENSGLQGLEKALGARLYSNVNIQSVVWENDKSLIFQMNKCWVQEKRKARGLDDYPCKSAGLVEYAYFAREIDKRIKTECIGCPPDTHPEEWYCAWRFYIED
ncbi:MAG: DUF6125 family protein [Desulfobacteraceae bacterium]|jgi:hypothetical protein